MSLLQFLVLLLYCVCLELCSSIDTISFNQSIQDPGSIVSNGQTFELGFFSPVNTTNRYVGIWYNGVPVKAVVWVANRGKPLNDSSGAVKISKDGDLVVLDGQQNIIWSSNLSSPTANSSAQLLDTGNLVLRDNSNGSITWESFQHPSDSFWAKMRIGNDVNTNAKILMTSWKSLSDPSVGRFSAGLDPLKYMPEIFVWNGSRPHWRSGPWNSQIFTGVPYMESVYLDGFNIVNDKQGGIYLSFTNANESRLTYFVLNSEGTLMQKYWDEGTENWESNWSGQISECDVYGKCGPFGSCNSQEDPICTCLTGFVPKSIAEWSSGNWTSGCVRKTPLQCEKNNSTGGVEGKEDGFLKLKNMKVPDFAMWSSAAEDECENECLKNCSWVAYAYHAGIGCMLWSGTLVDIQKFSITRPDLYIRLAYSDLEKKRNMNLVIAISVIIGSLIIAVCIYFSWCWRAKRRDSESGMKKQAELLLFDRQVYPNRSDEIIVGDVLNKVKLEELPVFEFDKIAIATDNFNSGSKLGQGGFGPVYKGILPGGGEIAVKRLSKSSGQGLKEFMNEVLLISKLQHRNLVRLLGCCAEGEEKMLIYEYMPNKSLDAFLFDPAKQKLLDWKKRFNIIEGIGRGLLYLHRDSRLKIIHRDLKASNILLDEELKPKISDFGMARIFGGNQDQDNTRRVVGTYGYMAPEYAMEGRFSEKSDVFSFGVLLLEIISGRRNTSFYQDEHSLGLVGFAWKLWNEDNNVALIDPTISDPFFQMKILGCIHVGLLCVQEFAKDRPSISSALSMLTGEIADLPIPKQPALTERHVSINAEYFQQNQESCSINSVTITAIGGR